MSETPKFADAVREFKRQYLQKMIDQHDGSVARCSKAIGMTYQSLSRSLHRYGVRHSKARRGRPRKPEASQPSLITLWKRGIRQETATPIDGT